MSESNIKTTPKYNTQVIKYMKMKIRVVRLVSRQVRDAVRFVRHNLKAVVIWAHLQLLVVFYVDKTECVASLYDWCVGSGCDKASTYNNNMSEMQPVGINIVLPPNKTLAGIGHKESLPLIQRALLNQPVTKKKPVYDIDDRGGVKDINVAISYRGYAGFDDIPPLDLREQPGIPVAKEHKKTDNKIAGQPNMAKKIPINLTKFHPVNNKASSRVLLFSYMRGGSSFVGQIFKQNPSAGYWYETVDGAYSALYGFPYLITSLDVTHFYNLTARPYPEAEKQYISESIHNMLDCSIESLPTEIQVHPFLYAKGQSTFARYGRCCASKLGPNAQKKCKGIQPECLKEEGRQKRRCYLQGNETMVTAIPDPSAVPCIQDLRKAAGNCQHLIKQGCNSRTLRVVKAVRLRMDILETLLQNHPDIKLIHYMRDPRAIVASRKKLKLLSTITNNDVETEARLLCENIVTDITIRKKLEQLYPNNVLTVYYEQFAKDPVGNTKKIYEYLGTELPDKVVNWLHDSTNAKKDGGLYQTFRKNSTETSISWEKHLTYGLVKKITKRCRTALELMGPEYANVI